MEISKRLLIAGVAIIVGGLVFGIVNKIYKNKITKIEESYTAQILEVNMETIAAKAHADSLDFIVARHELEMDSINKVKDWYKKDRDRLEDELIDAWNEIFDAGEDANYEWLHARYPTEDTLKFPFSGEQVQGIALDLIKLDYKDSIINNRESLIKTINEQIGKCDSMIIKLEVERHELEFSNKELRKDKALLIEESRKKDTKLKKRTRRGVIGTIISFVGGLFTGHVIQ